MKNFKLVFLFMVGLNLVPNFAFADDAAKPPPPSAEDIAAQKAFDKMMKHLKPFHSVDDLKKYHFDISASGGTGKMDMNDDSSDACPQTVQLKVFGPFAKIQIGNADSTNGMILTQDNLRIPKNYKDIPQDAAYIARDDEGRLVIMNNGGMLYITPASSSVLFQGVKSSDNSASDEMQKGMLPIPKAGTGCILSLDNQKSDRGVKSGQVAAKLEGRHLAVINADQAPVVADGK